jgi:hypothetical protein
MPPGGQLAEAGLTGPVRKAQNPSHGQGCRGAQRQNENAGVRRPGPGSPSGAAAVALPSPHGLS